MSINRGVANTVIGLVAFMALLLGLVVNRILTPTMLSREEMSEQGLFVYDVPRRFADFSLIDSAGQPLGKSVFAGRWTLVFFGFTQCPDVCPTTLATLRRFHESLAEQDPAAAESLQVLFVSVDPMRDTPEKIGEYVHYFDPRYLGATGEHNQIFTFAHALNIAFAYVADNKGGYDVSHSGEVALINPEGDFHGFFKSSPDPQKMLVTYASMLQWWQGR